MTITKKNMNSTSAKSSTSSAELKNIRKAVESALQRTIDTQNKIQLNHDIARKYFG